MNEEKGMSSMGIKAEEFLPKKNKWQVATIVLGFICMSLLAFMIYNNFGKDWKGKVCDRVKSGEIGTPSWFSENGTLITSGFIPLFTEENNQTYALTNSSILKEMLIDKKIYFVYRDGCSWCKLEKLQMDTLGFWEDYKSSGLTIGC